jgi:hypothetical protein
MVCVTSITVRIRFHVSELVPNNRDAELAATFRGTMGASTRFVEQHEIALTLTHRQSHTSP